MNPSHFVLLPVNLGGLAILIFELMLEGVGGVVMIAAGVMVSCESFRIPSGSMITVLFLSGVLTRMVPIYPIVDLNIFINSPTNEWSLTCL